MPSVSNTALRRVPRLRLENVGTQAREEEPPPSDGGPRNLQPTFPCMQDMLDQLGLNEPSGPNAFQNFSVFMDSQRGEVLRRGQQMEGSLSAEALDDVDRRGSGILREGLRNHYGVICVPLSESGELQGMGMQVHRNGAILMGNFQGSTQNVAGARLGVLGNESISVRGDIVEGSLCGEDGEICLPGLGRYAGAIREGVAHGMGVWVRDDSSWYEGQWRAGRRHGRGSEHIPVGNVGNATNATNVGNATNATNVGNATNATNVGNATNANDANDATSVGNASNVSINSETSSSCILYSGEWEQDLPHGVGRLREGSAVYEGNFDRGRKHGAGQIIETCTACNTHSSYWVQHDSLGHETHRRLDHHTHCPGPMRRRLEELEREVETLRVAPQNRLLVASSSQAVGAAPAMETSTPRRGVSTAREVSRDHTRSSRMRVIPQTSQTSQTSQIHQAGTCKVCLTKAVNRVLRPCNHACLCHTCVERIQAHDDATHTDLGAASADLSRDLRPFRVSLVGGRVNSSPNSSNSSNSNLFTTVRIRCPICRAMSSKVDPIILS